jgi:hypothetical protein
MIAVRRWPLAIVAGLLLAGCATVPSAPGVMALPGSAKSADEFLSDDAACRQAAEIDAKATKQWRYDMIYLQCMYAKAIRSPSRGACSSPRRCRRAHRRRQQHLLLLRLQVTTPRIRLSSGASERIFCLGDLRRELCSHSDLLGWRVKVGFVAGRPMQRVPMT